MICIHVCVHVCVNYFVPIAPLVQNHHIPSYNVALNQLLVTNVGLRYHGLPKSKDFFPANETDSITCYVGT